ncbi:MAG: hypothetical protein HY306_03740 [Nitrosomonadales bacterium]|nr:hypothetical protein [Nitrosomonadales bacterium]
MAAVFGIDARNAEAFLGHDFVCLDKSKENEETVLHTFRRMRAEDIIFIKDFNPQAGLSVKAAGVVMSDYARESRTDICIPVEWVWSGEKFIGEFDEKCALCDTPFYEEHNITIQREIIDLMPGRLKLPDEW